MEIIKINNMTTYPSLILHVGVPKTATFAIQRFCLDNMEILQKHYGVCYPDVMSYCEENGIQLKEKYREINGCFLRTFIDDHCISQPLRGIFDFISQEINNNRITILSEENMSMMDFNKLHGLLQSGLSCNCKLKVVIYLRRQDRFIESMWNQAVKDYQSLDKTFRDYITDLPEWPAQTLHYLHKIKKISEVVGKSNVIVRVFEDGQFKGNQENIFSDFLDIFNIELSGEFKLPGNKMNSPIEGNFIELKRILNSVSSDEQFQLLAISIISKLSADRKKNNSAVIHAPNFFTPKERSEFMKQFEEENATIAREFLDRKDCKLFYDENYDLPVWKLKYIDMFEDIIKVFGEVFGELIFEQQKYSEYLKHQQVQISKLQEQIKMFSNREDKLLIDSYTNREMIDELHLWKSKIIDSKFYRFVKWLKNL